MKLRNALFRRLGAVNVLLLCITGLVAVICLVVLEPKALHSRSAPMPHAEAVAAAGAPPDPKIERGRYLTDAGNCISCHTRAGSAAYTGGVSFETPFGTIYSTNITPDQETGIGNWSLEDLRRAVHEGIAPGGYRFFPAFPYASFTRVADEDVGAIYAYLRTLKPIRSAPIGNDFIFSQRWVLRFWNGLFFEQGRFIPNRAQSFEWNRGAYLVEGLGHCGACHTPRNAFMAEVTARKYAGGLIRDKVAQGRSRRWSAVNLTSAKNGLASWSIADLTNYLQTGFTQRAGTFGPMNEVIVNSLKKMTREDVHAMALYLKSLPASEYRGESVSPDQAKAGESIYKDRCEKCHSSSGRGGMFSGPPLAGSPVVQAEDPASLINIILYGPETPKELSFGAWETMMPYSEVLDDSQVAAVSNYVRGSWGNRASPVKAADVAQQR
jgi:mono/diheme cytochrome c family protein